ncbi:hypothetical protein J4P02_11850 [Pseudomonas sp. NFXW11]|uniref:Imm10 family immunity protein n=1 Tax=Pseudomonas sp. NFXW11 TaxID=2819531 RepID=UPI003CECA3E8
MQLMFQATTYSAFTEDQVRIFGLADDPQAPEHYLLLQRAESFDEQDQALGMDSYYLELGGQQMAGYGGVDRLLLEPGQLTLHFSTTQAWCRDLSALVVRWSAELASLEAMAVALEGIFEGCGSLIEVRQG